MKTKINVSIALSGTNVGYDFSRFAPVVKAFLDKENAHRKTAWDHVVNKAYLVPTKGIEFENMLLFNHETEIVTIENVRRLPMNHNETLVIMLNGFSRKEAYKIGAMAHAANLPSTAVRVFEMYDDNLVEVY